MSITRRDFLSKAGTVTTLAAVHSLSKTPQSLAATLKDKDGAPRTIVGYCWPWTVRPGETLDFMVSAHAPGHYQAELVRIICGDSLTSREMFKERKLKAPFSGRYPGRFQPTHTGSFVEIAPKTVLDRLASFTVQAMVCPALLPDGIRPRLGGIANSWEDPVFQDQHLVSRWDNEKQRGWALLIDKAGRPVLMLGDGAQVHRAVLDKPLVQDKWFLIAGGIDAQNRKLHVSAKVIADAPGDLIAWPERRHEQSYATAQAAPQAGPLRFGTCTDGPGNASRLKQAFCFNGRLDRVRITEGVLDSKQLLAVSAVRIPVALSSRIIGFWDFGRDIDKIDVTDLSPNALHGATVNLPTRAVMGVDWDGSGNDWRQRPDHYSAIHFHDDDLYDSEWQKDFSYTVPADLPSGIYAARLRHGESEDYIPFFVAPPRGETRAAAALLIPTANYTAYTNVTGFTTLTRKRRVTDDAGQTKVVEEDIHPDLLQNAADAAFLLQHHRALGKGIYANHTDGTLTNCASQRHPNMTIKPKGINWTLVADTYITDWLEHRQIPCDIITDDLLHAEGVELLERYAVVMTGNHPEYYTRPMLDAVDQYQKQGGRWMYLGGNGFWWVTSFHSQLPGVLEVRKDQYAGGWRPDEIRHSFDGVGGGKWELNGRPVQLLTGVSYSTSTGYAMEGGAAYKRLPDSRQPRAAFVFEGVTHDVIGNYGLFGGGAAGQEVDAISRELGTPAHALHLARADEFARYGDLTAEEYKPNSGKPIADMVYFETPNGGAVFTVGSMSWVGALSHNRYDNDVARITENVLRRFMDKTPLQVDL